MTWSKHPQAAARCANPSDQVRKEENDAVSFHGKRDATGCSDATSRFSQFVVEEDAGLPLGCIIEEAELVGAQEWLHLLGPVGKIQAGCRNEQLAWGPSISF